MAINVLAMQASSVPCERLFSSGKLSATRLRSRLTSKLTEQIQILKSHWKPEIFAYTDGNTRDEIVNLDDSDSESLIDILAEEKEWVEWDDTGVDVVNWDPSQVGW